MFRRQDTNQNNNIGNVNNEIRNEVKAEDTLLNVGNEASGQMGGLPNLISNEANEESGMLAHYQETDLNKFRLKTKGPPIPEEIIEDGLEDYYKNDLNIKDKKRKKNKNINILNEIPEKGMSENKKRII